MMGLGGLRAATLERIAGMSGVSRSTVYRGISTDDRVGPARRHPVFGVIAREPCEPKAQARSLASGRAATHRRPKRQPGLPLLETDAQLYHPAPTRPANAGSTPDHGPATAGQSSVAMTNQLICSTAPRLAADGSSFQKCSRSALLAARATKHERKAHSATN